MGKWAGGPVWKERMEGEDGRRGWKNNQRIDKRNMAYMAEGLAEGLIAGSSKGSSCDREREETQSHRGNSASNMEGP